MFAALGALAGLVGCADDPFEPAMRYRMLGLPTATDGACPATDSEAAPAIATATRARLTYLDADTRALRCDVVLGLDAPPTVISVPEIDRPVDLVVEYVDDSGAVLGRGETRGVLLDGAAEVDVRIAAASAFGCAPERAGAPRAFHSATALPGGELLLLGGVAGLGGDPAIDPAAGWYLQPRAEIFTPATGAVRSVTIAGLVPRAFHQAYVIGSDTDGVTIAVIGGLTVTGDPATTAVLSVSAAFRLEPSGTAIGAPGEILRYDPTTSTFTRSAIATDAEARGFGALPSSDAAAIAYVGGFDLVVNPRTAKTSVDQVSRITGERAATLASRRARLGATVTALSASRLLVWGGDLTAGVMGEAPEVGELLDGWDAIPTVQAVNLDGAGEAGTHRAFHAAARAGDGSVIIAGGFDLDSGAALSPAPLVVQRVAVGATSQIVTTLADAAATTPAGYLAAVSIPDGDVLLGGGNPDPIAAGCATDHRGLLCAIGATLRYDSGTGAMVGSGPLGVPRYGHQLTVLDDGTIAATGGLSLGGGALFAVVDIEVYEPRGVGDDPLLPAIARAPGDVARTASGAPLAPCDVVTTYDEL